MNPTVVPTLTAQAPSTPTDRPMPSGSGPTQPVVSFRAPLEAAKAAVRMAAKKAANQNASEPTAAPNTSAPDSTVTAPQQVGATPNASAVAAQGFNAVSEMPAQGTPVSQAPASPVASSQSTTSPAATQPSQDNSKHDAEPTADPTVAAAAMLALLGQSAPEAPRVNAKDEPVTASVMDAKGLLGLPIPTLPLIATSAVAAIAGKLGQMVAGASSTGSDASSTGTQIAKEAQSPLADSDGADDTPVTGDAATSKATFESLLEGALPTGATHTGDKDQGEALRALTAAVGSTTAASPAIATPAAAAPVLSMQAHAGTPGFAEELGQHIAWMTGQDVNEARIRLSPRGLGQLDVKVSVVQDHVDVAFIAQHPNAVHAVQQTLTDLSTLLATHGLSLGQASVGQGRGDGARQGSESPGQSGDVADAVGAHDSAPVTVIKQAIGLLDTFA